MEHIITTQNLSFEYHAEEQTRHLVLKDINLQFEKGQFIGIIGHNGSGKSTLAKHFNALLLPTEGKVHVKGMDTKDTNHLWDIRQTAGLVFQNPDNQIVATIVEEDVAFGPENLGIPPDEIRERVEYALKAVGMWEYKDYPPHMLSGGQKQRVAIAGIIAMKPECIILDEPTAMLDPIGRREVISTIKKLNKEDGITVILITHFMEEVVDADRVIVMDNGKVVLDGTPKEVFKEVALLKKIGLSVPQVTELAYQLKREGFDVPLDILTVEEMVEFLCR
ncbi:energy-coupling factor transport system ATP-binding protein [Thermoanaerobacter thermohydrosulfuricus]|uniref:ABC transporter ATP-binding protein n=3 Tax=Thermoanaerobacter TaxID=1754 RepID=I8R2X0_9THEO|nr:MULTISPECIES: energy-coupling factor transporter ATPase [Thermoanaerobacter]EGD51746.1 ABC transporter related protein [Thermoanaerobacter ethanolicus JW 200]EIV99739.1 cobalt transport protein ATP-binding subunit [Thermoanaerobacter siderophilus SR4]EMT38422.1 cobalt transport protein ATP-binding subunit [Thermoanaerobacter thermohydrosulfuricus WC1]SDG16596.1 energy-coupling factor transport system ATP-binding protein [Thermoanaerobacter thermohydrosulfuricus]SFE56627.1 energy-coupling fa